jgi:hypothetical protein
MVCVISPLQLFNPGTRSIEELQGSLLMSVSPTDELPLLSSGTGSQHQDTNVSLGTLFRL